MHCTEYCSVLKRKGKTLKEECGLQRFNNFATRKFLMHVQDNDVMMEFSYRYINSVCYKHFHTMVTVQKGHKSI